MRDVHLKAIDLNLLTALGALLRHRGVSKAARDIGLSQPAMSRALDRLRHLFGDELLVRSGTGMTLTARAEALAPRIANVLAEIRDVIVAPDFDPRRERRVITIAAADAQTALLFPGAMRRLASQAPHVDIRVAALTPDIARRVQTGEVDFTFSLASYPLPPGARSEPLMQDRLTLAMRRGNPAAARGKLSLAEYAALNHVTISIFGDGHTEMDTALATAGLERRIGLTTPHFVSALAAVAQTDMVAMMSWCFARRFAEAFDLALLAPPIPTPPLDVTMVWAPARDADRLLAWLREIFREVAAEVAG